MKTRLIGCLVFCLAVFIMLTPKAAMTAKESEDSLLRALAEMSVTAGKRKVPLTLLDTVRLGLTRNVDLKKSLLDRATQRMDLALAERLFEPEFYLSAGYDYAAETNTDTRSIGLEARKKLMTAGELTFEWSQQNLLNRDTNELSNQSKVGFKLSQPLLRNAGITVGTSEVVTARNTEAINQEQFKQTLINNVTSVQEAYWNLLLALENRLSAVRSLQASQDILRKNKILIQAGRMAPADIVETEQEVAARKVDVLEQEFTVDSTNRTLVNLLDLQENVAILPIEGLRYREVAVSFPDLVAQALEKNPQVVQAKITVTQTDLDLKLARSAALDEVNLTVGTTGLASEGSAGQTLDDATDLGRTWTASLQVSVPLGLPRDRLQQNVAKAVRELQKAKLDMGQTERNIRAEVRDRVNDVIRSLRQIKMAQESRELARRKYEIERTRLELGRSDNFRVISFQRDLASARDKEHSTIVTYLISLARLDAAVGASLKTWNIEIETPVLPKPPSLNISDLKPPQALPKK